MVHTRAVVSRLDLPGLHVVLPLVAAVACSPGLDGVGVSTAQGGSGGPATVDAGAEAPLFDPQLRASLVQFGKGDETSGHAPGLYDFSLFANESARATLASGARSFPLGSVLGVDHQRRDGSGKGPSFFMEKRSASGDRFGGWRFVAVDGQGRVVDQGQLEACGHCHRDAPTDYVFPALTPVRPADAGAEPSTK